MSRGEVRTALMVTLLTALASSSAGCGYLKNVRDDMMDIATVSIGVAPPVVPTQEGHKAAGPLPQAIGAYVEVTDFLHLGGIWKSTRDIEWDRRGVGILSDSRTKIGFGPLQYIRIDQEPLIVNDYKAEGNALDEWREHMRRMRDPFFDAPAKELIYRGEYKRFPFLYKGWQDWETVSFELAIPEPFITQSGFYFRAGLDVSQAFDALLSLVGIDLYSDAAYNFDGSLRFGQDSGAE